MYRLSSGQFHRWFLGALKGIAVFMEKAHPATEHARKTRDATRRRFLERALVFPLCVLR